MDDWGKFNETSLTEKEDFYSDLNMENITNADYAHAKRVFDGFERNKLREYHYMYIQSNTLLLAELKKYVLYQRIVLENLRNMCLKIHELDPAKKISAPALAWQLALKKTKEKFYLLTDINILLIVEKEV